MLMAFFWMQTDVGNTIKAIKDIHFYAESKQKESFTI